jgi:hypothetical protein
MNAHDSQRTLDFVGSEELSFADQFYALTGKSGLKRRTLHRANAMSSFCSSNHQLHSIKDALASSQHQAKLRNSLNATDTGAKSAPCVVISVNN